MAVVSLVLLGVIAWGAILLILDNPTIPAYKAKQGYRLVSFLLLFLLLCASFKALAYRTELRELIAIMR